MYKLRRMQRIWMGPIVGYDTPEEAIAGSRDEHARLCPCDIAPARKKRARFVEMTLDSCLIGLPELDSNSEVFPGLLLQATETGVGADWVVCTNGDEIKELPPSEKLSYSGVNWEGEPYYFEIEVEYQKIAARLLEERIFDLRWTGLGVFITLKSVVYMIGSSKDLDSGELVLDWSESD